MSKSENQLSNHTNSIERVFLAEATKESLVDYIMSLRDQVRCLKNDVEILEAMCYKGDN